MKDSQNRIKKQRGSQMAKSYGIKILIMQSGEELIATVDEFDSKKVTIHYPLKIYTEATTKADNSVSYKISFRAWMKHSPQQHFTVSKSMFYMMVDPYDDIAKQYIDIVRKLPREDKQYIDMEQVLDSYSSPKGIGQGTTHEGMREPTQAEVDKVVSYIEQCGFAVVDAGDIMDSEVNDEDYDYEPEEVEGEHEDDDEQNNGGWNPFDRWSK